MIWQEVYITTQIEITFMKNFTIFIKGLIIDSPHIHNEKLWKCSFSFYDLLIFFSMTLRGNVANTNFELLKKSMIIDCHNAIDPKNPLILSNYTLLTSTISNHLTMPRKICKIFNLLTFYLIHLGHKRTFYIRIKTHKSLFFAYYYDVS